MTKDELIEAVEWYINYYGTKEVATSEFLTWIGGQFKTYPKMAKIILEEMRELGFVSVCKGKVKVTYNKKGVTCHTSKDPCRKN